jgi:hypothetical protein
MKKNQVIRYSDEELNLLKNTFAESDELLNVIRKVMLQMVLTDQEKELVKLFKGDLMDLLTKFFIPELSDSVPFNQNIDLWLSINIADKTPEEALRLIKSRKIVIEYLKNQLAILNGLAVGYIPLDELLNIGEAEQTYINFLARDTIISHTEQVLLQIKLLAGNKNETPEETLKRLQTNSSK